MNKGFTEPINIDNYLTIEALEDNLTVSFTNDVEYAIDSKEWIKLTANSATQPINVGQTLSFRGEFTPNSSNGIGTFTINKKCNLKGNCMSMIFGDNAADNYSLSGKNYAFYKLFYNCSNIVNVSSNFLPATTLASGCYGYMFQNCRSLITAPKLPATTLTSTCYQNMFRSCSLLTVAPELPATTLAMGCYSNMFQDCTSLTTAPELPATTLANSCYSVMFYGCSSLTAAPALPATTLRRNCYFEMFDGCRSLTTAPELPATTLAEGCYEYMFYGCSSLTAAPALPATTLYDKCYASMFYGCTSLTTAPELPATTLANYCYSYMFYNCTKLNYIKCLATSISATGCTDNWVNGVAPTGTFVKAADMTGWTTGSSGIPNGWAVENYIDYNKEPLTFNILSDGTINWTASKTSITKTIEYKLNDGEWTSITSNTGSSAPTITVNSGDKIQFRGNNEQYGIYYDEYNSFSGSTASFEAEGNIMSLIYGDDFKNKLTISSTFAFARLFRNCTKLVSAENLILPATTLASNCYDNMFRDCTSLTSAPELPATTLANTCYNSMFWNCTSLTTAPELPATTLAISCYGYMFRDCTSLTTAPALPATTLTESCYRYMFNGCTKLNYIKCLATDISAYNCTTDWVSGVASTGTFVKAADMTGWTTGSSDIPTGWTVQNA